MIFKIRILNRLLEDHGTEEGPGIRMPIRLLVDPGAEMGLRDQDPAQTCCRTGSRAELKKRKSQKNSLLQCPPWTWCGLLPGLPSVICSE